jgi:phosphoribosyl 1,2-cyclic phosphate phosphodiesterase
VFVHGPNIVFDTPEDARLQLDRARIETVSACFYSHWHPDHTMGRRVWETRNADFRTWPREAKRPLITHVYLPEQVALDFRDYLGAMAHLDFMRSRGWIRIHELADGDVVRLGDVSIRPFRLAQDYVYAFELIQGDRRLLVAMDELNAWRPPPELRGVDVAVLPMGICEFHPFTGERRLHPAHPVLVYEATFAETLDMIAGLDAGQVVLFHIEEIDGLTHDELQALAPTLGDNITFAWDGFTLDV